jgi:SEC-C motif-containing protein
MMKNLSVCPCGSTLLYEHCCRRFHDGAAAPTALDLMRSRYAAYALGKVDYIIQTTHPNNRSRKANLNAWKKDLQLFCTQTNFVGLQILSFEDGDNDSTVTFNAKLEQGSRDASFTEKSFFEKVNGRWLYKSGQMQKSFL